MPCSLFFSIQSEPSGVIRLSFPKPAFTKAFNDGELEQDLVAVLPWQGPSANGMPELHKLTPYLGVLQNRGFKVALLTDGRMSGASGKVLAAIQVTPEAADGGVIARIRDGDMITIDGSSGNVYLGQVPMVEPDFTVELEQPAIVTRELDKLFSRQGAL